MIRSISFLFSTFIVGLFLLVGSLLYGATPVSPAVKTIQEETANATSGDGLTDDQAIAAMKDPSKDLPKDSSLRSAEKQLEEKDIPVLAAESVTEKKASPTVMTSNFNKIAGGMVVVFLLLVGVLLVSRKWVAAKGKTNLHTTIKIITQHHLGARKSLAIIRVAGESILIGITDQNISLIKELSLLDEDLPQEVPKQFQKSMQLAQKEDQKRVREEEFLDPTEAFSIKGIREAVNAKLKNMKELG